MHGVALVISLVNLWEAKVARFAVTFMSFCLDGNSSLISSMLSKAERFVN